MSSAIASASTNPLGLMQTIQTKIGARLILFCAMITFMSCTFLADANQDQVAARGFFFCGVIAAIFYAGFWLSMLDRLDEKVTQECLSHPWGSEARAFLFQQFKLRHFLREWDVERADKIQKETIARVSKETKGAREERARMENQKMLARWEEEQKRAQKTWVD